jgi:hypothetical protein
MQINIKLLNPLLFYKKISIINYNIHAHQYKVNKSVTIL